MLLKTLTLVTLLAASIGAFATEGYKYASLAIVGGGQEVSTYGGHAYLILSNEKEGYSSGVAYQYNLKPVEGKSLLESPFLVERVSGAEFVMRYRLQNRVAFLYSLKLSEGQIENLEKSILSEAERRFREQPADYDILKKNCLTTIIGHVNRVVPKHMQIKTIWGEDGYQLGSIHHYGAIFMNIPLLASRVLNQHPLVEGEPEIVLPYAESQLRMGISFRKLVFDFATTCGTTEASANLMARLSANSKLRERDAYLNRIQKIHSTCSSVEADDLYITVLDFIWTQASSQEVMERVDAYYL